MEKYTIEVIEQYLENKLDVSERLTMEEAMELNPELKEEVLLQKALVQKIEDQALRALVNDAHLRYMKSGGGSDFFSNNKWILGSVILVLALVGFLFYESQTTTSNELNDKKETQISDKEIAVAPLPVVKGTLEKPNGKFPEVQFMAYTFFAEKGAEIKDPRSGTVIKVPANILIGKDGSLIKGQVVLKYREFRNQADIALSGIPMTYKEYNFNSAGMFEMYALQNGDTLSIKNGSDVSVDFVMTKNEAGIGFYQLDNKKKQWAFIRSLDDQTVYDGFGSKAQILFKYSNRIDPPLTDAFVRSLGYQKAAIEGETVIPELPRKMDELFADTNYKQISGSGINDTNRIVVKEIRKQMKTKGESGFAAFFKKTFPTGGGIAIPINDKAKVDTSLSIVVNNLRYSIYENGKDVVMTELSSLKGSQFVYKGEDVFGGLTKMTFYDMHLTRDTTFSNRFVLELKTDGEILRYQLQLSKPDFTAFAEYDKQQRLRMLTYNNRVKLSEKEYKDLIQLREERTNLLDSVSLYGNESIFRMARLIMTDDELDMSQEDWFASLDTNKTLRKRIDAHLDSIKAYGDNADVYINKLAKERKQNIESFKTNENFDVGMNYVSLVANLKIKGFGVYNCDQVYRIKNPIVIKGKYVTEENIEIRNFMYISLIDPKVNASFSIDPKLFTCSASEDNILLLSTGDNKIYFFSKAKWSAEQIVKAGSYTFEMVDITSKVKTSKDLQRIIEEDLL